MGGFSIGRLFYEIGGDTSRLNESLKQAMDAAEAANVKITRAGQNVIASFDAALNPTKALSEQIKLLELAGRSAGDIVAVMGKKIETATQTATSNGQAIDATVQKYVELGKQGSKSGISIEDLGKKLTDFARNPMEAAKAGLSSFLTSLGPTAVGLGAIATAAIAAGAGVAKFAIDAGEAAEKIQNLSLVTGLTVEKVQALERLGKETGVGDLFNSLQRINKELGRPEGGEFTKGLLRLGIDTRGIEDGTDAIIKLKDQLDQIPDRSEASRVANAALGKGYEALRAIVLNTELDFRKLLSTLEHDPMTKTAGAEKALADLDDEVDKLGRSWERTKSEAESAAGMLVGPVLKSINAVLPFAEALAKALHPIGASELSKLSPIFEVLAQGMNLHPWTNAPTTKDFVIPDSSAQNAALGSAGRADLLAERRNAIAEAEARASGVRKDLLDVTIQLQQAERRLATEKANEAGQFDPVALKAATDEIVALKDKKLAIEAAHKAEITAIENLKKPLDEQFQLRRNVEDLEIKLSSAIERDDLARAARLAIEIGLLNQEIKAEETLKNARKIQDEIDVKGHAALVPGGTEIAAGLKKLDADAKKRLQEFGQIEADINKQITSSDLEQLRIQEQILGTITPIGDAQRVQFALEKIHLQAMNREEEIRLKFTQSRKDLLEKIAKLDPTDPLRMQAMQDLGKLTDKMNEQIKGVGSLEAAEALKVHRDEYNKMIDSVRDGAGKVFDAMVSRGKGAFQNLSDWIESVFLSKLRGLFQNLMEIAFDPKGGGGASFTDRLLKGILPGSSGKAVSIGGVTYPGWTGAGTAAGATGSGGFLGGIGGLGGLGAAAVPGLGFAGVMSSNPYLKALGGVGLGVSGGAAIGVATGAFAGFGPALAALLADPLTAIIAGGILGGIGLYKVAKGKNAWTAGGMETSRDFGVDVTGKAFKSWSEGLGLNESTAYPIRKDLQSSPLFLTQVAAPAAKAQGKMDDFLKSLEAVKTSWGTFDFRKAFELGNVTGDWTELDKVFKESFKDSKALQENFPNWEETLLLNGKAADTAAKDFESLYQEFAKTGQISDSFQTFLEDNATLLDVAGKKSSLLAEQILQVNAALANKPTLDGLTALKAALEADTGAAEDFYQNFYKTGEITDAFSAKITELGGDLSKFEEAARLGAISKEFDDLSATFRSTGEILPRMRDLFKEFGGDLKALDDASALTGLQTGLDSLHDFTAGLQRLLDVMSPVQQVLAGEWGADTWAGLFDMGLDPSKLTRITDLIKETKAWEAERAEFEKTGKLKKGGTLEQSLSQFGGAAGTHALEQYAKGYNIITPEMLDKTKAALDKAYHDELKTAIDYIGTVAKTTSDQIDALNVTVEAQLKLVGTNITAALDLSKADVIAELGLMLDVLKEIALNTGTGSSLPSPGTIALAPIVNNFNFAGARIGPGDVKNEIEDAIVDIRRRGGFTPTR